MPLAFAKYATHPSTNTDTYQTRARCLGTIPTMVDGRVERDVRLLTTQPLTNSINAPSLRLAISEAIGAQE